MEVTASLPQRVRRFKGKVPINPYVVCHRGCAVSQNNMGAAGLNAQAMPTCTAVCLCPTRTLQTDDVIALILFFKGLNLPRLMVYPDTRASQGHSCASCFKDSTKKIQVEVRPGGNPSRHNNELRNRCNKLLKTQGRMWTLK